MIKLAYLGRFNFLKIFINNNFNCYYKKKMKSSSDFKNFE